jgi:tetratricopeptide (TPR) repeat protein
MGSDRTWLRAAAAAAGVFVLATAAGAETDQDRTRVIQLRAERLAAAGKCGDMVELANSAPEPARGSAELLRLKGNCLIDLARYDEALTALEQARAANGELADIDLLVGVALYHQEDLDGAEAALERARGHTDRTAELDLYTGLVLLQRGQPREAALALERARNTNPDAVEPVASYYAALAWHADRESDRAHAALARVRAVDPDGPWARQATRALGTEFGQDPYWARLSAGLEYDSNVRLSPSGDFPDADDGRAVWAAESGVRLLEGDQWSGGLVGSYTGSAHFDLPKFDTHYPVLGVWFDRRIEEEDLLRLRYDAGYAWVDYDPFLFSQWTRASWFHAWQQAGLSELFVSGEFNDFKFSQASIYESNAPIPGMPKVRDRSGEGIHTGLHHRIPLGGTSAVARGGYTYSRYWSRGEEWDFDSHRFHLGGSMILPADIVADVEGGYSYRPHRNPTTFNDPSYVLPAPGPRATDDRRDHVYTLDASLEKGISERWAVSTAYHFIHSNSNSGFFDYDRHVIGAYLTVSLP